MARIIYQWTRISPEFVAAVLQSKESIDFFPIAASLRNNFCSIKYIWYLKLEQMDAQRTWAKLKKCAQSNKTSNICFVTTYATKIYFTYFIVTPPSIVLARSEGLLLLHSFLSLDILVAVFDT